MKLNQWTLFIDMLGYGALNNKINSIDKANELIKFMRTNVEIFKSQDSDEMKKEYSQGSFDLYMFYEIQIAFISDSLIINYFPKEVESINEKTRIFHSANTLFIIIKRLQTFIFHCMLENNIFVRGGISDKFCFVDGNFAVGEGLIEAYKIESEKSIYPRICLSESILSNTELIKSFEFLTKAIYQKDTFLRIDNDKQVYLDYMLHNLCEPEITNLQKKVKHRFFEVHKNTIEHHLNVLSNQINQTKDEKKIIKLKDIFSKYEWLKEYHNSTLNNYKENMYIIK